MAKKKGKKRTTPKEYVALDNHTEEFVTGNIEQIINETVLYINLTECPFHQECEMRECMRIECRWLRILLMKLLDESLQAPLC